MFRREVRAVEGRGRPVGRRPAAKGGEGAAARRSAARGEGRLRRRLGNLRAAAMGGSGAAARRPAGRARLREEERRGGVKECGWGERSCKSIFSDRWIGSLIAWFVGLNTEGLWTIRFCRWTDIIVWICPSLPFIVVVDVPLMVHWDRPGENCVGMRTMIGQYAS